MADGAGYVVELVGRGDAIAYQYDEAGRLVRVGVDLNLSRPFYLAPDEAAHDQGDVCDEDGHAHDAPVTAGICDWCGDGVGEWVPMGYTAG